MDANVQQNMIRGGFSPVERNLLSASGSRQAITGTYECRGARSLQFVLGFEDRGARLRLSVVRPDGAAAEKTGTSNFTIDVPEAAAGKWQYTVTPVEVPYPNFPFSFTVGEEVSRRREPPDGEGGRKASGAILISWHCVSGIPRQTE